MTTVDCESLPALAPARRIDLDGRRCVVTPDRVDIRSSRALILLPTAGLSLGLLLVAAAAFWWNALPVPLAVLLALAAMIMLAVSGVTVVSLGLGAELVVDRPKQSAVRRRGPLGLGTRETLPFQEIERLEVEDMVPRRRRGVPPQVALFEVGLLNAAGRRLRVGAVTVPRSEAAEGLDRARSVAEAIAGVAEKPVRVRKARHRRPRVVRQQYLPPRR